MKKTKSNTFKEKMCLRRGLLTISASLLALFIAVVPVINNSRTDIDKFLGTHSTKVITAKDSQDKNMYGYKSDYTSTKELLTSIKDLGERMNEEGSVLLKNDGALPLSEKEIKKVSLLGFSSYFPVQGGDMGSSLDVNVGTDADTVDLVTAFTSKGFKFNPTVKKLYESLKASFKSTRIMPWGQAFDYYRTSSPSIGGTFKSLEPAIKILNKASPSWQSTLNDYNVMIVTFARGASENGNYTPGKAGVDPDQHLNQTDPLGLSDTERAIIKEAVCSKKESNGKIIVLLNNASAMEIEELKENKDIDAILEIGLPGGYGFYGVADILNGKVNPSGHLSDTYAVKNANSPAAQNYGDYEWSNADSKYTINSELVEAEGIYTGYKYYETRYADCVLNQGNANNSIGSSVKGPWSYKNEVSYPFGFGLSYTTFTQTLDSLDVNLSSKTVTAKVSVRNIGKVTGKDVVQLYVSLPYTDYDKLNGVEKSAIQLLDYEKTENIAPGESVTITIQANAQNMTSWDSLRNNAVGTKGTYILDNGNYYFTIGNGAHEAMNNVLAAQGKTVKDGMTDNGKAKNVKIWNLGSFDSRNFAYSKNGTAVEDQLSDMDLNTYMPGTVTYLTRKDWAGTWPKTYRNLTATKKMVNIMENGIVSIKPEGNPSAVTFEASNGLKLADLKGVSDISDSRWDLLMNQITLDECMLRTAFGGTSTKPIASITSPEAIQNDGPNGISSYPLGQYADKKTDTNDPCAVDANDENLKYRFATMSDETVIAQTFSKKMAAEYGRIIGNYSLWSNLTIFWGSGINLHRVPYNARNHEYYSEDPILTAYQASSYIAAGKKYGCIIAIKHFAFNDTEINRTGLCAFMTEQNAREQKLRGAQYAIEDAGDLGVMTTFNRIGVTAGNAHYGLLMNILRKEWGFKGLMSEDFIQDPLYASLKDAVHCGVTMTCNTGDDSMDEVSKKWSYWTTSAVGKDASMMQDLKNDMLWQNYALANSNAMDGLSSASKIVSVHTWYDIMLFVIQCIFGILTIINLIMYGKIVSNKRNKEEM